MKWTSSMKKCREALLGNSSFDKIKVEIDHPGVFAKVYFKLKEQGKIK